MYILYSVEAVQGSFVEEVLVPEIPCVCMLMPSVIAGNFSQLCEFIGKSADVLAKNANHLDNVMGAFDVQQHSLGVLGIL